jgi:uncharacterized membrane protein YedE/YeeE
VSTVLDAGGAHSKPATTTGAVGSRVGLVDFVPYVVVGVFLGVVLLKSEVIFWSRINEMFRFQSFHMYGVLGSALFTALVSVRLMQRAGLRDRSGEPVALAPKELGSGRRYWIGGALFGVGWALCGACPGPLFALMGSGETVFIVIAFAALAGTWAYGYLRPRLPH